MILVKTLHGSLLTHFITAKKDSLIFPQFCRHLFQNSNVNVQRNRSALGVLPPVMNARNSLSFPSKSADQLGLLMADLRRAVSRQSKVFTCQFLSLPSRERLQITETVQSIKSL
jgi:hypothetical protein